MTYTFNGIQLPDNLRDSIDRYVEHGVPTGGFLEACIDNDLREACGRADHINIHKLPVIVAYLYNHTPSGCWGFEGAHDAWCEKQRTA